MKIVPHTVPYANGFYPNPQLNSRSDRYLDSGEKGKRLGSVSCFRIESVNF